MLFRSSGAGCPGRAGSASRASRPGGTSRTVTAVARDQGAKEVLLASRSGKNGALSYEDAMKRKDVEVVVNVSPAGMYPNNGECLLDLTAFPRLEAVADVVYNPFHTALLQQAEALALRVDFLLL